MGIGPITVPEVLTDQLPPELNNNSFEFEQSSSVHGFCQGNLKTHISFWKAIGSSEFVLDIIAIRFFLYLLLRLIVSRIEILFVYILILLVKQCSNCCRTVVFKKLNVLL